MGDHGPVASDFEFSEPSVPRATYGVAVSIIDYLSSNKDKTMTEILEATKISRMEFNVTIGCLTGKGFVRGGYEVRTTGGRRSNFYLYNIDDEGPIKNILKQLRETLPD